MNRKMKINRIYCFQLWQREVRRYNVIGLYGIDVFNIVLNCAKIGLRSDFVGCNNKTMMIIINEVNNNVRFYVF